MKIEARVVLTRGLMLFALMMLAAGCASLPTGRFDALATASKSVETKTVQTDADLVRLARRFMVFVPAPGPYKIDTFAPVVDGQDFDFAPRLAPRQAALDVLASYTEALAAFARRDYLGDGDRASQELGGGVARLASLAGASGDAKESGGILAKAVTGLGRRIIERQRRAALRSVMDEAAPGVAGIVKFVKDINGSSALVVGIMRDHAIRAANRLSAADGVARLQLNEAVESLVVESAVLLAQLKQESAAIEAIGPAHAEIRASLDQDERISLDKLKALLGEVKRLQGAPSLK